jgi:predicted permease
MQRFALELLPALAIGLVLGRAWPDLPARLGPPLVRWGVPISLTGLLLRAGLRPDLLITAGLALAGSLAGLLLIRRLPALRRRLPNGSLQLGSISGNTAYWGLPAAVALLPPAAIAHAITYDLIGTLVTWSVGPLLVEGIPASGRALLAALRTSPASVGLVVALALQLTPWNAVLADWLWWPARIVLLVALAMVGMRLGVMLRQGRPRGVAPLGMALLIKLLLFPALMLLAALALGVPGLVRGTVVLQAAAPTAISVLLIAEAAPAGREAHPQAAAALVLSGTLIALVTVPIWGAALAVLDAVLPA